MNVSSSSLTYILLKINTGCGLGIFFNSNSIGGGKNRMVRILHLLAPKTVLIFIYICIYIGLYLLLPFFEIDQTQLREGYYFCRL